MKLLAQWFLVLTFLLPLETRGATPIEKDAPIQVFILAGQSNMQGQGVVDLDHPRYYNGGRGILKTVMKGERAPQYSHVTDDGGKWVVRDDVFVRFQTKDELKRGGLSIGFAGYPGKHHIGPEFQFGHVVGEAIDEPVLLIKTAWGGKSLFKDFRPPSSGEETGPYFKKMIAEVEEGLAKMGEEFPQLAGRKHMLAGFVWFQGWNDMYDEKARAEYEQNLVNLIQDVRSHFRCRSYRPLLASWATEVQRPLPICWQSARLRRPLRNGPNWPEPRRLFRQAGLPGRRKTHQTSDTVTIGSEMRKAIF